MRRDQANAWQNDEDVQDAAPPEKWQRVATLGQTVKSHGPPENGATVHGEESGDCPGDPARLEDQYFQAARGLQVRRRLGQNDYHQCMIMK